MARGCAKHSPPLSAFANRLEQPPELRHRAPPTAHGTSGETARQGKRPTPEATRAPIWGKGMQTRWERARAWDWYRKKMPIRGCNYLPRSAVNPVEMWGPSTFDSNVIEEEAGWAQRIGLRDLRVFLPYIVWESDRAGFYSRFERFLNIVAGHRLRVVPVLFDDCGCGEEPHLGPQGDPVTGVHNSRWVASPGPRRVRDRTEWGGLETYVEELVGRFSRDDRILAWDLYNEPGNREQRERSLPFLTSVFDWAREASPSQPITAGVWHTDSDWSGLISATMLNLSDVVSFHAYGDVHQVRRRLLACGGEGRPMLCTEWLCRQRNNTVEEVLPVLDAERVGWFIWGLVAGRTQTFLPWESKAGDAAPAVWQHDLLHEDGTPYDESEVALLRASDR